MSLFVKGYKVFVGLLLVYTYCYFETLFNVDLLKNYDYLIAVAGQHRPLTLSTLLYQIEVQRCHPYWKIHPCFILNALIEVFVTHGLICPSLNTDQSFCLLC